MRGLHWGFITHWESRKNSVWVALPECRVPWWCEFIFVVFMPCNRNLLTFLLSCVMYTGTLVMMSARLDGNMMQDNSGTLLVVSLVFLGFIPCYHPPRVLKTGMHHHRSKWHLNGKASTLWAHLSHFISSFAIPNSKRENAMIRVEWYANIEWVTRKAKRKHDAPLVVLVE